MSSAAYIYGESNGQTYVGHVEGGDYDPAAASAAKRRTHWDPRIEVKAIAGSVQVGVIPASENSTDETGLWDSEDGQFLSLSRDGVNRLIIALREARIEVHGVDA